MCLYGTDKQAGQSLVTSHSGQSGTHVVCIYLFKKCNKLNLCICMNDVDIEINH